MKEEKYIKLIGARIKEIRISKKISQADFAYECGFDKSNMNRIEAGGNNLTIKTLLIIAGKLGVSIHDLLPRDKSE